MTVKSDQSFQFMFILTRLLPIYLKYSYLRKYFPEESIALFTTILKNPWLGKSSMILFLNKKDIFDEKIQYFDLKDYFPDYRGKFCDSFEAKDFILEQFVNPGKRLR